MFSKKRDIELFIVDVFVGIYKVKKYIKPFDDADEFLHSSLHWDATMRQLEIIGEALNRLLEDELFNTLAPSYFRKVVNFRNSIAHGYFGIDTQEVWNIVTQKLDLLSIDMKKIVKDSLNIDAAILSEIKEYENVKDNKIVLYLKQLLQDITIE